MSEKWAKCLTCEIDFGGDVDSFINHMESIHADDKLQCTICSEIFDSGSEYSMHYIYNHTDDGVSQQRNFVDACDNNVGCVSASNSMFFDANTNFTSDDEACPVCSAYVNSNELNKHVNAHFDGETITHDANEADYQLALELERQDREERRKAEESAFLKLQKEYGMDEQGSYKQQGTQALESAYNKGRITLGQLYTEKVRLSVNQKGVEDSNYGLKGLIDRVRELSRRCADVLDTFTCTNVDYFSSSAADFGFGCGYRNIQMMISSLKHYEPYRKALFRNGEVHTPSIPKIQSLIEEAWANGFDPPGREQLNGKLSNTKKWIGATETCVLLMSFRLRVGVVDFRSPTGPNGTHPQMLKWVYEYFRERRPFTPPLYFQHQGHSRTIIGVERTRSGHFNLLLFDPSSGRKKMEAIAKSADSNSVQAMRKSVNDLKKSQFQIVVVKGLMESEAEFQKSKLNMDVTRVPA